MRICACVAVAALLGAAPGGAKKPVTLDALREASREESSARGRFLKWAPDGKHILFEKEGAYYLLSLNDDSTTKLVEHAELRGLARTPPPPAKFDWTNRRVRTEAAQFAAGGTKLLFVENGDAFLYALAEKKLVPLTETVRREEDFKISPDGKRLAWRYGNDLYSLDIETRNIVPLTQGGSETLWNGRLDWVYPEELDLTTAYWWSPDSASIAYLQFDVSQQWLYPHADLTGLDAIFEPQRYPRAGTPNARVRLGVVSAAGGPTVWAELGEPGAGLIARVEWLPDASALLVQRLNRVQSRLDLLRVDAATGKAKEVLAEEDPAWVNVSDDLRILDGGKRFLWSSERDGRRHLYLYTIDGRLERRLTAGEWDVTGVGCVDERRGLVFYESSQPGPLERAIYRMPLGGGAAVRITPKPGTNSGVFAPGCNHFLWRHSSLNSPPGEWVADSAAGIRMAWREPAFRDEQEYEAMPEEIVQLRAPDGETLYARLIKPAGFQQGKRYPAIVIVYGGPQTQAVRNSYRGVRTWEQVMAQKGFVIWQLDNRGSAGRGHGWEKRLHRRLGKTELEDQLAGLDYLISLGFTDPARIGIHGWSYGGFMTLYAMLHAPERFAAGIAGAPVTDWRLYDTIYTERYLGLPEENAAGYRDSSPVHFAANLQGKLMLIHNYEDDNVLYQHTVRMAQALTEAGKQFRLLAYPQKAHGVTGAARRHMYQAMTEFLEEVLKGRER